MLAQLVGLSEAALGADQLACRMGSATNALTASIEVSTNY